MINSYLEEEKYLGTKIIDNPDPRDFQADHMLGLSTENLPETVDLTSKCIPHNQGNTNHCTAYGLTHIHQILNSLERGMLVKLNPEEQWNNQKVYPGTANEQVGDYLQSALKSLKEYGLKYKTPYDNEEKLTIDGYAVVHRGSFKSYLAKGMPVYTGTHFTATNYKKAKETGYWGGIDGPITGGHAICLVGYNKIGYIAMNSWGKDWGKFGNGTFVIKYKDAESLFTSYILFDTKDINKIFRDVSDKSPLFSSIKWASDNGLIKGYGDENIPNEEKLFMPDNPITRSEMCVVLERFYNLLKK